MNNDTTKSTCPVCNASNFTLKIEDGKDYFIYKGISDDFQLLVCNNCSNGWAMPYLTNEELAHYYPEEYESFVSKSGFSNFLQVTKYKSDIKLIEKNSKKAPSIFEIGAGRGDFLSIAKSIGCSVSGLEPGEKGVNQAKKLHDIELENCFAEELTFKKTHDIVAARHVLEHVNNPIPVLKNIYDNGLAKGGKIFLKLPRLDSGESDAFGNFWDSYDLPRHRVHFSKKGITYALESVGFKNVNVINEVVPTSVKRSLENIANFKKSGSLIGVSKLFNLFPDPIKMIVSHLIAIILGNPNSGRMIIIAEK